MHFRVKKRKVFIGVRSKLLIQPKTKRTSTPPHPKPKMETQNSMFGRPVDKNYRLKKSPLGREGSEKGIHRKAAPSILVLFILLSGIVACSATLIFVQTTAPKDKTSAEWFDESVTGEQAADTTIPAALASSSTQASSTMASTTTEETTSSTISSTTSSTTLLMTQETMTVADTSETTEETTTTSTTPTTKPAAKKLKVKTTTTTTTTTLPCGADLESPCEAENGNYVCNEGNIIGGDNICHTPTCLPSVDSGLHEGNCGAFALKFCQ